MTSLNTSTNNLSAKEHIEQIKTWLILRYGPSVRVLKAGEGGEVEWAIIYDASNPRFIIPVIGNWCNDEYSAWLSTMENYDEC